MSIVTRLGVVTATIGMVASAACSSPSAPDPIKSLTILTPAPGPGATIPTTLIGSQYFVARGSGLFSVPITVTSDRDAPYAQLYVYLMDGSPSPGYCGQNLPDAPTWGPFAKGQTASVTITGFQLSRALCQVTSLHVYLHTRNNGSLTPPNASETIVDGSLPVNYTFRASSN